MPLIPADHAFLCLHDFLHAVAKSPMRCCGAQRPPATISSPVKPGRKSGGRPRGHYRWGETLYRHFLALISGLSPVFLSRGAGAFRVVLERALEARGLGALLPSRTGHLTRPERFPPTTRAWNARDGVNTTSRLGLESVHIFVPLCTPPNGTRARPRLCYWLSFGPIRQGRIRPTGTTAVAVRQTFPRACGSAAACRGRVQASDRQGVDTS